jgi:hypothetical protein
MEDLDWAGILVEVDTRTLFKSLPGTPCLLRTAGQFEGDWRAFSKPVTIEMLEQIGPRVEHDMLLVYQDSASYHEITVLFIRQSVFKEVQVLGLLACQAE